MTEGLVDHDIGSESSLEEATQSYLDALISSSLIMVDHIKKSITVTQDPLDLLRVLQLDRIIQGSSLMKEIGSLFHLRFLRIQADIKAIPLLWLLMNTGYSTMVLLPRILELSKLKHVKIDKSSFLEVEEEVKEENDEDWDDIMHEPSRILEAENSKYPDKMRQPNEYYFPNSLKELRLSGFSLRPDLLSAISALPQLEILEFVSCNFKWDASEDIYQNLKTLTLREANISEWEVDREPFPKLEELILEYCNKLREIPCAFMDIGTLKSIHLINIKRELGDSAIEIKKQNAQRTQG
ncbi:hypothetical protein H5410_019723 [Solanum commersonii]|uniref:Uncharacterized protein n=1 Tax=Solanum commersonii TaxID=4109 RepID=A0A9J5Z742_SOLCO|nr:hypothetical protein H5410_019723 [Solanum commersonii]